MFKTMGGLLAALFALTPVLSSARHHHHRHHRQAHQHESEKTKDISSTSEPDKTVAADSPREVESSVKASPARGNCSYLVTLAPFEENDSEALVNQGYKIFAKSEIEKDAFSGHSGVQFVLVDSVSALDDKSRLDLARRQVGEKLEAAGFEDVDSGSRARVVHVECDRFEIPATSSSFENSSIQPNLVSSAKADLGVRH